MVHSGGFEPPTARFVAGYSIQLSYECSNSSYACALITCRPRRLKQAQHLYPSKVQMAERGGFEPPTPF